jgi:5-hydroxyisourate hydrolase
MSTLSTHVLDSVLGVPATGIRVHVGNTADEVIAGAVTDADGRIHFDVDLDAGVYVLTFETGAWFAEQGRDTFFPGIGLAFRIDPSRPHHHVALLLSPYAYTTYRGS